MSIYRTSNQLFVKKYTEQNLLAKVAFTM